MGKTRLVAEARASAQSAGFEVLAARGGELEEAFAYGVVRQLFEPLVAWNTFGLTCQSFMNFKNAFVPCLLSKRPFSNESVI